MGRSEIAGDTSGDGTKVREFEEQLVKTARVYAMCQKARFAELLDVTAQAVAAFEDMPLEQAIVPVRSNERNVEDVAWAFGNAGSLADFERRLKEIKTPRNTASHAGKGTGEGPASKSANREAV